MYEKSPDIIFMQVNNSKTKNFTIDLVYPAFSAALQEIFIVFLSDQRRVG